MRQRLAPGLLFIAALLTIACGRDADPSSSASLPAPQTAPPTQTATVAEAKATEKVPPPGSTLAPANATFKEFHDQLQQYLVLRAKVENSLPKLTETKDPKKIAERAAALAAGLQDARKGAKQGDIFTPLVTVEFRRILKDDAAARTKTEKTDIMAEVPVKAPAVNALYPTDSPQGPAALPSVPPNLLAVLPELPDTVEYRFLGNALVLRDASANLIIDFLPSVTQGRSGLGGVQ